MDILYRHGEVTAADVRTALPDPPSYSAVRAVLRVLEDKGHVQHARQAGRYVFQPIVNRTQASRSALRQLVDTFFDGSPSDAAAALIDDAKLSGEDMQRLTKAIAKARREGR